MQGTASILSLVIMLLFWYSIFIGIPILTIILVIRHFRKKYDNKKQCKDCIYYQQHYETQNEK